MHLALKRWLVRKWSTQVLVGLQVLGSGHLALGLRLACPGHEPGSRPMWGHLALGCLACALGQTHARTWR